MLTSENRLTSGPLFAEAIKRGQRAGSSHLVVHLLVRDPSAGQDSAGQDGVVQVGFVVSRQVGNAVARNKVKRRLRHLARERVASLPGSAVLVVRALPPAAGASYAELAGDLDRALSRLAARSEGGVAQ